MLHLEISQRSLDWANQCAESVSRSGILLRTNYTGSVNPKRYLIGYLGELTFAEEMARRGIGFIHRICTNGKSQNAEFIVSCFGRRSTIEIKTASQPSHQYFMYPAGQDWQQADFYVAMRLQNQQQAAIMGYLEKRQVQRLPVKTFPPHTIITKYCHYSQMLDIENLFRCLDLGEGVLQVNTARI